MIRPDLSVREQLARRLDVGLLDDGAHGLAVVPELVLFHRVLQELL